MTTSAANSLDWQGNTLHLSFFRGRPIELIRDGDTLLARDCAQQREIRWNIESGAHQVSLTCREAASLPADLSHIYAAIEGALTFYPTANVCRLNDMKDLFSQQVQSGVLLPSAGNSLSIRSDMLWQLNQLWLAQAHDVPLPLSYTMSHGYRHPLRPAKPRGMLYQRFIPWLGKTLSFRALDVEKDGELVHRWMNDPVVARIWQEEGDLQKHRQYLRDIEADPHMYSMIASIDDQPFAYFEAYWAKENRISPFCEATDFDRGWHVLVGEEDFRGKAYATAWLTSISHYLFLDDPRTMRIVGEPRVDHVQQIRNLDRSGYAKPKEFDFPHKRAQLVTLLRERFFADSMWWPRIDRPSISS